ncbi:MAG: diacylglycerol kinase family protein [Phycisphaerales bacterium]|jgi:diacylglycerol kinase family enzyme|nr:diacylglycerol kinase family protein [Phycisphaerales bacterium]
MRGYRRLGGPPEADLQTSGIHATHPNQSATVPRRMRILIVANPISGEGRARRHSEALAGALAGRGHDAISLASEQADAAMWLPRHLDGADAIAVVGGDGTVRSVAAVVAGSGVPLVHVPQGNENLFARSLGMGPRIEDTVRLLERGDRHEVDMAVANGRAMLLMASMGLDAEIVADVATRRRDRVSNMDYLAAAGRALVGWRPTAVTVRVDGEVVVPAQSGWVVVSNASMYGGGINPAPMARMDDRLLDLTFFRASSALEMAAWFVRCRLGLQREAAGFVHRRVPAEVVIEAASVSRWQLDGDPPPAASATRSLTVRLASSRLVVLGSPHGGTAAARA